MNARKKKIILMTVIAAGALVCAFFAFGIIFHINEGFVPADKGGSIELFSGEALSAVLHYNYDELLFEGNDTARLTVVFTNKTSGNMEDIRLGYTLPFGLLPADGEAAVTVGRIPPLESAEVSFNVKKEGYSSRRFLPFLRKSSPSVQVPEERRALVFDAASARSIARGAVCEAAYPGEVIFGQGDNGALSFVLGYTLQERLELTVSGGSDGILLSRNSFTGIKSLTVQRSGDMKDFTDEADASGDSVNVPFGGEGEPCYFRVRATLDCGAVYSNTATAIRDGGKLFLDSDSDMLSDELEELFGFSPVDSGDTSDFYRASAVTAASEPETDIFELIENSESDRGSLLLETLFFSAAEEDNYCKMPVPARVSEVAAGLLLGRFGEALSYGGDEKVQYGDARYAYYAAGRTVSEMLPPDDIPNALKALRCAAVDDEAGAREALSGINIDDKTAVWGLRTLLKTDISAFSAAPSLSCRLLHLTAKWRGASGADTRDIDVFARLKKRCAMAGLTVSAADSLERYLDFKLITEKENPAEIAAPAEEQETAAIRRAVIIVPGIAESELAAAEDTRVGFTRVKKGTVVWPPEGIAPDFSGDVSPALLSSAMTASQMMRMNADGIPRYRLEGMEASPDGHAGTFGVWDKMYGALREAFGGGRDVVFFGYDWRLSSEDIAQKLEFMIERGGWDSVTFVCHNTGSFAVSGYLSLNEENVRKTDRVIAIGTPFGGSPAVFSLLEQGRFTGIELVDSACVDIIKNVPALYELLPEGDFISSDGRTLNSAETKEYISEKYNGALYEKALASADKRRDITAGGRVNVYVIAGSGNDTVSLAGGNGAAESSDGDGYVLLESAVPAGECTAFKVSGAGHMSLLTDGGVIALTTDILRSPDGAGIPASGRISAMPLS